LLRPHGHDALVHGAMVRSVPPAAWRKTAVLSAVNQGRQRPQSEEQQEDDGEATPHLRLILADNGLAIDHCEL